MTSLISRLCLQTAPCYSYVTQGAAHLLVLVSHRKLENIPCTRCAFRLSNPHHAALILEETLSTHLAAAAQRCSWLPERPPLHRLLAPLGCPGPCRAGTLAARWHRLTSVPRNVTPDGKPGLAIEVLLGSRMLQWRQPAMSITKDTK